MDNEGLGRTFSPTDTVAVALASCVMTILGIVARRDGLKVEGMRAEVTKIMATEGPRRIAALPMRLVIPGPLTDDQKRKLEKAAHACPVKKSLHPDLDASIEFVYE